MDSVNLSDPSVDVYSYLQFRLQIFPSVQDSFNRTSISTIGFLLNRQSFLPQLQFYGPFFFIDEEYCCFSGNSALTRLTEEIIVCLLTYLSAFHYNLGEKKKSNIGAIVGASVGGVVLFVLILFGGFYAYQRKRANRDTVKSDPFGKKDQSLYRNFFEPKLMAS